jgi:hypothetical protein
LVANAHLNFYRINAFFESGTVQSAFFMGSVPIRNYIVRKKDDFQCQEQRKKEIFDVKECLNLMPQSQKIYLNFLNTISDVSVQSRKVSASVITSDHDDEDILVRKHH